MAVSPKEVPEKTGNPEMTDTDGRVRTEALETPEKIDKRGGFLVRVGAPTNEFRVGDTHVTRTGVIVNATHRDELLDAAKLCGERLTVEEV